MKLDIVSISSIIFCAAILIIAGVRFVISLKQKDTHD